MLFVLRPLKTVLKDQIDLILKTCFNGLMRNCFKTLTLKHLRAHEVKKRFKTIKRFSLKLLQHFCPSWEPSLIDIFHSYFIKANYIDNAK